MPAVKYVQYLVSYVSFWIVFNYFLIMSDRRVVPEALLPTEIYIFIYWVAFCCDELRQVMKGSCGHDPSTTLLKRFYVYFESRWNRLDAFLVLFSFSIIVLR